MRFEWKDHRVEVRGDWTSSWLFLAPKYELVIDDEVVDQSSGPLLRPRLEVTVTSEQEPPREICAELLSVAGLRPRCALSVDGEVVERGRVRVDNLLNPFLVLFILFATLIMLYLGPDVLSTYLA